MDKKEILADLRAQFGNVTVLYAKEIAVLLSKPSTGAIYELIKRGGLPIPVKMIGGSPAVTLYDAADWLAGGTEPRVTKAGAESKVKAMLPKPTFTVNKAMAKAMSLLRGQRNFLFEVDAELEKLMLKEELAAKAQESGAASDKPKKAQKPVKSLKTRTDLI